MSLTFEPGRKSVAAPDCRATRRGLTLAELLVAMSVMALVVTALGVFTKAVMDGCDEASKTGTATQAARVVTSRIARAVAISRQVVTMNNALQGLPGMDQVLMVWERDGEPGDTAPGQMNLDELVIYMANNKQPTQLLEIRPQVDSSLLAPLDDPAVFYAWLDRFRNGQDIVQPAIVLMNDLGGVRFDVEEYSEPQGIGGMVQQNVRIVLCVSPPDTDPDVFFSSATRRYVTGK